MKHVMKYQIAISATPMYTQFIPAKLLETLGLYELFPAL